MTVNFLILKNVLKFLRLFSKDKIKPASVLSSAKLSNFNNQHGKVFPFFSDMIVFRRDQANRSALVELETEKCAEEVVRICENFGTLNSNIFYHPVADISKSVCLVEFENENQLKSLLNNCKHSAKEAHHVFSRMLMCNKAGKQSLGDLQSRHCIDIYEYPENDIFLRGINSFDSATKQMKIIYEKECLSDFGFRIRFLICTQIEDSLQSLFPLCQVLPFGSSVNGFGRYNCDLDAVVDLDHLPGTKEGFNFQTSNKQLSSQRARSQVTLNFLGDLIQNFFPGVSSCQKILDAKVPILKLYHSVTGLDCDISVCSSTGFYMSELLYLFGEMDERVRPLVFTLRRWAKTQGITQDIPGPYITNFSLTLMVIFFLQCQKPPVVPSLEILQSLADNSDSDDKSCTFQRNVSKIPKSINKDELGTLFINFFLFYEKLSFNDNAISIISGNICKKPNRSALFIQNPLELHLNVSENVSYKEIAKFKSAITSAVTMIDEHYNKSGVFQLLVPQTLVQNSSTQNVLKRFHMNALFEEKKPADVLPKVPLQTVTPNVLQTRKDKNSTEILETLSDTNCLHSTNIKTDPLHKSYIKKSPGSNVKFQIQLASQTQGLQGLGTARPLENSIAVSVDQKQEFFQYNIDQMQRKTLLQKSKKKSVAKIKNNPNSDIGFNIGDKLLSTSEPKALDALSKRKQQGFKNDPSKMNSEVKINPSIFVREAKDCDGQTYNELQRFNGNQLNIPLVQEDTAVDRKRPKEEEKLNSINDLFSKFW